MFDFILGVLIHKAEGNWLKKKITFYQLNKSCLIAIGSPYILMANA